MQHLSFLGNQYCQECTSRREDDFSLEGIILQYERGIQQDIRSLLLASGLRTLHWLSSIYSYNLFRSVSTRLVGPGGSFTRFLSCAPFLSRLRLGGGGRVIDSFWLLLVRSCSGC